MRTQKYDNTNKQCKQMYKQMETHKQTDVNT